MLSLGKSSGGISPPSSRWSALAVAERQSGRSHPREPGGRATKRLRGTPQVMPRFTLLPSLQPSEQRAKTPNAQQPQQEPATTEAAAAAPATSVFDFDSPPAPPALGPASSSAHSSGSVPLMPPLEPPAAAVEEEDSAYPEDDGTAQLLLDGASDAVDRPVGAEPQEGDAPPSLPPLSPLKQQHPQQQQQQEAEEEEQQQPHPQQQQQEEAEEEEQQQQQQEEAEEEEEQQQQVRRSRLSEATALCLPSLLPPSLLLAPAAAPLLAVRCQRFCCCLRYCCCSLPPLLPAAPAPCFPCSLLPSLGCSPPHMHSLTRCLSSTHLSSTSTSPLPSPHPQSPPHHLTSPHPLSPTPHHAPLLIPCTFLTAGQWRGGGSATEQCDGAERGG